MVAAPIAAAQPHAVQVPEPDQAVAAQPAPEPRGFFESIGRWFDQGTAGLRSHLLGAKDRFDDLNQRAASTGKNIGDTAVEVGRQAVGAGIGAADVTRDAVGAVAKLPLTRVVIGRERCPTAANGAPDCVAAAEALCRKQGYGSGKSLDFTSAESCSARAWLGGRQPDEECVTVTFVSRAMCQ